MSIYRVGIDFGTSQTKICSVNTISPNQFIFHKFTESKNYFLPSSIKLNENSTCSFGLNEPNLIRYFKMKALFDENKNYEIIESKNKAIEIESLTQPELEKYPEICCILYLAYCILDVKESFNVKKRIPIIKEKVTEELTIQKPKIGFLSRFFGKLKKENKESPTEYEILYTNPHEYVFTIGIPTQYDHTSEEHKRRSKQYEMLYLSVKLAENVNNKKGIVVSKLIELLAIIQSDYHKLLHKKYLNEQFYINNCLYVIAETTAGIIPVKDEMQKELNTTPDNYQALHKFSETNMGNYITMDVGAGTTDISFFKFYLIKGQIKMKYYASKSIALASNVLILKYLDTDNLEKIFDFDIKNIDALKWRRVQRNIREQLFNIIRCQESQLYFRVSIIFNNSPRKYWDCEFPIAKGCKVYGGGSRFSEFNSGQLMLDNGGHHDFNQALQTFTELKVFIKPNESKDKLRGKLYDCKGKPLNDTDEMDTILRSLDILNIALGLAYVDFNNRPDGENGWIEMERLPNDPQLLGDIGMANYDIFNRDWIGNN